MSGAHASLSLLRVSRASADRGLLARAIVLRSLHISRASRLTYRTGQRRFARFALSHGFQPFPAREADLCLWVADMSDQHPPLRYATIQGYVAHVRSLHVERGFDDAFASFNALRDTLRGARRVLQGGAGRVRRPLTVDILRTFVPFLRPEGVDDAMV